MILTESDEDTQLTVPLVVYVAGVRHVIGEATVKGSEVTAVVGPDVSEEIMDQLHLRQEAAHFSIGFTVGPNPFRNPVPDETALIHKFLKEPPDFEILRKNIERLPRNEFSKKYDGPIFPLTIPSKEVEGE